MTEVCDEAAGQAGPSDRRALFSSMNKPPAEKAAKPPNRSSERRSPFAGTCPTHQQRKPQRTGWRVTDTIASASPTLRNEIEKGLRLKRPAKTRKSPIGDSTKAGQACHGLGCQIST
jgi:hypothetical protein